MDFRPTGQTGRPRKCPTARYWPAPRILGCSMLPPTPAQAEMRLLQPLRHNEGDLDDAWGAFFEKSRNSLKMNQFQSRPKARNRTESLFYPTQAANVNSILEVIDKY